MMIAVAALGAQTVSAQTVVGSKNTDNWYLGVNAGVTAPATGYKVLKNLNPEVSLRAGRWFTPAVGFAVEGTARLGDKPAETSATFVKSVNASLLGTVNFMNWFGGYAGQPRAFEVIGVAGLGWERLFGTGTLESASGTVDKNALTSKLAVDLALNLGKQKAWQVYLEPNIVYALNRKNAVRYDIREAVVGVNVGVNYRFGNSNGTHNFKLAQLRDQQEIDALNAQINTLKGDVASRNEQLLAANREADALKQRLAACEARPVQTTTVVEKKEEVVLQPIVIFRQGRSTLDAAGLASVEMVAKYMKNHPQAKVLVRGFASPEGNAEVNKRISEQRASVVKDALVKRYKVSADRITTEGMGATDKLSEENDFNRVAMFIAK